jgi:HTH-type transcriptional regulator/antitoxin HipB
MRIIYAKDFGKLIRDARKKVKLTQGQLAAASGIGERFVRELEKGKTTCQLEKALLVAQMLGIKFEAHLPPSITITDEN